ncbi:hypothetical protein PDESU_02458 [Pontiella desulfatans]|uniref:Uncharacterized protein n=1 Tax=Pontiella desulfatans TaxID=2750659 RepID=A0A6C2U2V4_PONDE|nr:hypothetical protein [Pontiella desulfatans]VGO13901.1 hypothetical protein PDESU_02458 [Pontiella desulfatans]
MGLADILRWVANRLDPNRNQPPPAMPRPAPGNQHQAGGGAFHVPPGMHTVLTEDQQATVDGVQNLEYHRRTLHMKDGNNGKYRAFQKNSQILGGCGCVSSSPMDVAFLSQVTGLPVCKDCEKQINRMRAMTRNEESTCNHKVAIHELRRVPGHGYMCPYCLVEFQKEARKRRLLGIVTFFIRPLMKLPS